MPVNVQITDTDITVTVENGHTVRLDRVTGKTLPKKVTFADPTTEALKGIRARLQADTKASVQVTPRWTVRVGDEIMAQHKKGGRKFRAKVRSIQTEHGQSYVQVTDPRNGGGYMVALDLIAKAR